MGEKGVQCEKIKTTESTIVYCEAVMMKSSIYSPCPEWREQEVIVFNSSNWYLITVLGKTFE